MSEQPSNLYVPSVDSGWYHHKNRIKKLHARATGSVLLRKGESLRLIPPPTKATPMINFYYTVSGGKDVVDGEYYPCYFDDIKQIILEDLAPEAQVVRQAIYNDLNPHEKYIVFVTIIHENGEESASNPLHKDEVIEWAD